MLHIFLHTLNRDRFVGKWSDFSLSFCKVCESYKLNKLHSLLKLKMIPHHFINLVGGQ